MPDFVARADYKYAKDGYVSLRAVGSELNADHTTGSANNTATAYGYGFALSGKQELANKDSVLYDVVYGDGTGRYVYDIGASANHFKNNEITKVGYYAGTLGFQHIWSDTFRSNLFGGYARLLNDTNVTGSTVNKDIASGHVNLIWQPAPQYKVGLEYMHGFREIQSGVTGNLDRTEASFIYGF